MIMNGCYTLYFSPKFEPLHLPKAFAMHEYKDVTFFRVKNSRNREYLFDSKIKVSEDGLYTESHIMKWNLIAKVLAQGNASFYVFSKENTFFTLNEDDRRFDLVFSPEEEDENYREFLSCSTWRNEWLCVQYVQAVDTLERRYVPPKVLGDYFDGDMTEPIESLISKGSSSTMSKGSKSTGNTSTESDDISFPKRLGYVLLFIAIIIILLMGC